MLKYATISDDANNMNPLTLNHLLQLRADSQLLLGVFEANDDNARRRWRQIQYLANLVWHHWIKEYEPIFSYVVND